MKLPPLTPITTGRLFLTGGTIGPLVDSIHNQCLLVYDRAPISIGSNVFLVSKGSDAVSNIIESGTIPDALISTSNPLICTSWFIPPLLGVAYVVLGGILPRLVQRVLGSNANEPLLSQKDSILSNTKSFAPLVSYFEAGSKKNAFLAVTTTAMIIKLSEILKTHTIEEPLFLSHFDGFNVNIFIMIIAALSQWYSLDRTLISLIVATAAAIGGPLTELPFVANGFWHYIPEASDYFPLRDVVFDSGSIIIKGVLGDNYQDLSLSSITGPCYFAVTMDAIALGRWYDSLTRNNTVDS
mmetsp:Transcript_3945/g.5381  ORF Transcript_3945/g.5381 Transcript_3945/m.5381 type:complete len:297 (-) Transcript_3945:78-968(-)